LEEAEGGHLERVGRGVEGPRSRWSWKRGREEKGLSRVGKGRMRSGTMEKGEGSNGVF